MPWQVYAYSRFPAEYKFEMDFNIKHFHYPMEDHSGTIWYYLSQLGPNYGTLTPYILIPGIIILLLYVKRKEHKIILLSFLLIPYILFSVFVATKMPAFCYIACVPVFMALGSFVLFFQKVIQIAWKPYSRIIICIALFVTYFFSISFNNIAKQHTSCDPLNSKRINRVLTVQYFNRLKRTVPDDYVVFGLPKDCAPEMMFYTGNTCYNNLPSKAEYEDLKKRDIKIAVILQKDIPFYLLADSSAIKLQWVQ